MCIKQSVDSNEYHMLIMPLFSPYQQWQISPINLISTSICNTNRCPCRNANANSSLSQSVSQWNFAIWLSINEMFINSYCIINIESSIYLFINIVNSLGEIESSQCQRNVQLNTTYAMGANSCLEKPVKLEYFWISSINSYWYECMAGQTYLLVHDAMSKYTNLSAWEQCVIGV